MARCREEPLLELWWDNGDCRSTTDTDRPDLGQVLVDIVRVAALDRLDSNRFRRS